MTYKKEIKIEDYPGKKGFLYYDNFLKVADSLWKKKIITPIYQLKGTEIDAYICVFDKQGVILRVAKSSISYAKFLMDVPDELKNPEKRTSDVETIIYNEYQKISGSNELK